MPCRFLRLSNVYKLEKLNMVDLDYVKKKISNSIHLHKKGLNFFLYIYNTIERRTVYKLKHNKCMP